MKSFREYLIEKSTGALKFKKDFGGYYISTDGNWQIRNNSQIPDDINTATDWSLFLKEGESGYDVVWGYIDSANTKKKLVDIAQKMAQNMS